MKGLVKTLWVFFFFSVLLTLPVTSTVKAEEKQVRLLIIKGDYPEEFLSGVSGYGKTTVMDISDAEEYSEEYLKENFDVFVVSANLGTYSVVSANPGTHSWAKYPSLIAKLWSAVEAGKSMIIVTYGSRDSPANTVVSISEFPTPKEFVEYTVIPNDLTQGVRKIECSEVGYFIYGGYPLVTSPSKPGYPDPPGALAVYGTYGKGKYAILSDYLFYSSCCRGDIGVLFTNIMHWLTNREMPAPPTLNEAVQKIQYINQSINDLYSDIQEIQKDINKAKQESQDLPLISGKIDKIEERLSKDEAQINELSREIETLKQQIAEINKRIEEIQTKDTLPSHTDSDKNNENKTCGVGFIILLSLIVLVLWSRR